MSTTPIVFSPMAQKPSFTQASSPAAVKLSSRSLQKNTFSSHVALAETVQPKFGIDWFGWLEAAEVKRLKQNPVAQQPELIGRMLLTLWQDNITGYSKPNQAHGLSEDSVRTIIAGYKRDKGHGADHITDAHMTEFIADVKALYRGGSMTSAWKAYREADLLQESSLQHVAVFMNYTSEQLNPVPRFDRIA